MRTSSLLSLLPLGVVPIESKLRSNGDYTKTRSLQERTTFQSVFDIDYLTNATVHLNLTLAAQALAVAYNDLVSDGYEDPFDRLMDKVDVLDVNQTSDEHVQNLPTSNLNAFLMVIGSCTGCPAESRFTVDVRRRNLQSSKKSKSGTGKGGKGKGKGSKSKSSKGKGDGGGHQSDDEHPYYYGDYSGGSDEHPDELDYVQHENDSSGSSGDSEHVAVESYDDAEYPAPPMLPTEELLRIAYAKVLNEWDCGIVDVVRLDEVEALHASPTDYPLPDSPIHAPEHPGESSGSFLGKGGKGGKGHKGGKEAGAPSSTCPELQPIGSFTGTFTSYFGSIYELLHPSDVDVEKSVAALTTAYNSVMKSYDADIEMIESSIFDPSSGRRLSFEEVDLRRNLQFRRPAYLQVRGTCSRCSQQFTFSNQVSGRRNLSGSHNECEHPGLPTAEDVRIEYNKVLAELEFNPPNEVECLELEEIDKVCDLFRPTSS